jgi:hypothetical protein
MHPSTFMKTFLTFAALVLGVGTIASCSSSSSGNVTCSTMGKCPGDMPQSQMTIDSCNKSLGDPACGAKYQATINCLAAKEVCGDAGGDLMATVVACNAELSAYSACTSPVDAASPD